jgi:hypothetical protein
MKAFILVHKKNCYNMGKKTKLMNSLKSTKDHMIYLIALSSRMKH